MSHVTYEIVEHDSGWAYRVDGVYSETFPQPRRRQGGGAARGRRAAGVGRHRGITWEDAGGRWHEEVDPGDDRPDTDVKG